MTTPLPIADDPGRTPALLSDAAAFVDRYHRHPTLLRDGQGWSLCVALRPTDSPDALWLRLHDGRIVDLRAASANPTDPKYAADVTVHAPHSILRDILRLRTLPNEPYLFGDLWVDGPQADFLRLDYVVTTLATSAESNALGAA